MVARAGYGGGEAGFDDDEDEGSCLIMAATSGASPYRGELTGSRSVSLSVRVLRAVVPVGGDPAVAVRLSVRTSWGVELHPYEAAGARNELQRLGESVCRAAYGWQRADRAERPSTGR